MASPRDTNPNDGGRDEPNHPLDELFIVGAKYHEPSAAEREAAARQAEKDAKREAQRRQKEVEHTRRVLKGEGAPRFARSAGARAMGGGAPDASYDRRNAIIGFSAILALSVLLGSMRFFG